LASRALAGAVDEVFRNVDAGDLVAVSGGGDGGLPGAATHVQQGCLVGDVPAVEDFDGAGLHVFAEAGEVAVFPGGFLPGLDGGKVGGGGFAEYSCCVHGFSSAFDEDKASLGGRHWSCQYKPAVDEKPSGARASPAR
jgi:hypothetical protein